MEKLLLLAAIAALPAICFMLMAKISGKNKWLLWLFIKGPSLVSAIVLIIIALIKFHFIKIA